MKKKHRIVWILAGVVASILMTQSSALAADKVVVIPLFSSGDEIPTVTSKTGRVWMDRNLGAIRVAGSISDSLAYGWLFQWGRPADGHESRTSPTTGVDDRSSSHVPGHGDFITVSGSPYDWTDNPSDDLWASTLSENNPCPPSFRLPSPKEWKDEIATWQTMDKDGAYKSNLKLTVGGRRIWDGSGGSGGSIGCYHTNEGAGIENTLYIDDGYHYFSKTNRVAGNSVRCIKD